MKELFIRKTEFGLIPDDDDSKEIYRNFSVNDVFRADHWKERNRRFHAKLFALAKKITDNNQNFKDPYQLIKALQFDAESVDFIRRTNGQIETVPKSLKFKSMGAVAFAELYKNIRHAIEMNLNLLLPGMSQQQFRLIADQIYNEF